MTNETTTALIAPSDDAQRTIPPEVMEKVVIGGDLSELNAAQRTEYYTAVCRSLGLNPLTKPFEFLTLNGKLRLYALRDCTDQLRRLHGISIYITNRERMGDIYIVTARAKDRTGREDESTGAVPLGNLKGDALANALMKCETKAKRRVTLSIAGLGWLDETELDTIHSAAAEKLRPSEPVSPHPLPAGEGVSQTHTDTHPTADEITRLVDTARAANVSLEAFGHDMRRLMNLSSAQKITKKFLRETMTMDEYSIAREGYGEKLRVIIEEDVPNHEPPAETREASASESVREATVEPPTGESTPAVPSASSSAPAPDAGAREKLRQEAVDWGIPEAEITHILGHHEPSKARTLLWRARRPAGETLTASAAD
jgi:hypothetical protein